MRPSKKYRVWDKRAKAMIYSGIAFELLLLELPSEEYKGNRYKDETDWSPIGYTEVPDKHFDIMEYIAYPDREGNEICEGDLLEMDFDGNGKEVGEVTYGLPQVIMENCDATGALGWGILIKNYADRGLEQFLAIGNSEFYTLSENLLIVGNKYKGKYDD